MNKEDKGIGQEDTLLRFQVQIKREKIFPNFLREV